MPEVNQVHIDAALTGVSVAYRNTDYIADLVAPTVNVRKQSDRYFVYDNDREGLRVRDDFRAPGAEADEVNFSLSNESYFCEDHALASAIPDEERENADPVIQPEIDRTEFLTDRILLNREVALENVLRSNGSIPGSNLNPGDEWDQVGSDPIADINAARLSVFASVQRRANTVVMPFEVFECFRNHPAVVDRVKYSMPGVITDQILASLLDVDRVLVARSYKNTASAGNTPNIQPVWGDNVYVMHVPTRPGLKQVSLAYTFLWNGMPGSMNGVIVEKWREARRKADMVRVQKYYDHKIVAAGACYRLSGVLAA